MCAVLTIANGLCKMVIENKTINFLQYPGIMWKNYLETFEIAYEQCCCSSADSIKSTC